jgi:16S rRNA processing protein RimM
MVCVGVITKPVGVRGGVRVRTFTETSKSFLAIRRIFLEDGTELKLLNPEIKSQTVLVAKLPSCYDRTSAEAFRDKKLFAYLDDFPVIGDDEYYLEGLIGMAAVANSGKMIGRISATFDFGAGAFLDVTINDSDKVGTIQFNGTTILDVDVGRGEVIIDERFLII